MTLRTKTSRAIGLAAVLLAGVATLHAPRGYTQGINLTPAQIQQLQNLSEEERQALLAQAGGQVAFVAVPGGEGQFSCSSSGRGRAPAPP